MKYRLICRVCVDTRTFESIDEISESGWSGITPVGSVVDEGLDHDAYCPKHTLKED